MAADLHHRHLPGVVLAGEDNTLDLDRLVLGQKQPGVAAESCAARRYRLSAVARSSSPCTLKIWVPSC
jgi:hypothetical protein